MQQPQCILEELVHSLKRIHWTSTFTHSPRAQPCQPQTSQCCLAGLPVCTAVGIKAQVTHLPHPWQPSHDTPPLSPSVSQAPWITPFLGRFDLQESKTKLRDWKDQTFGLLKGGYFPQIRILASTFMTSSFFLRSIEEKFVIVLIRPSQRCMGLWPPARTTPWW